MFPMKLPSDAYVIFFDNVENIYDNAENIHDNVENIHDIVENKLDWQKSKREPYRTLLM